MLYLMAGQTAPRREEAAAIEEFNRRTCDLWTA
jgi:hypothetical protein